MLKNIILIVGASLFALSTFGQQVISLPNAAVQNAAMTNSSQPFVHSSLQTTSIGNVQSANFSTNGPSHSGSVPAGDHVCRAHELNEQYWQNQGLLNEYNQSYIQAAQSINNWVANNSNSNHTPNPNEISVIFHVVHNPNNPAENVSNALIMQVFQDLTEDYQLLNANAANARGAYGFVPADADINFCLATQDPLGNPLAEVGVIRVSTTEDWYDSDNGEENKMKSSATGGSEIWDRDDYLNVWICDISNGAGSGTAGYAYRPTPPSFLPNSQIDGIVLDYNLGMNNENVLTHEVGHYLGLDHTWGGSGGCGSDDGFGDTPATDGPSFNYSGSCSGFQETCPGTQTQYENYMDYANCTVMFTQEQADYMLMILTTMRSSLMLSPGCDPTNTPPNSAFASVPTGPSPVIIPQNASVNFYDQSTNAPTAWTWTISGTQGVDWQWIGGTNANSQDPQAEFYTIGTYDVTLTASNVYGVDPTPAFEAGYVQVVGAATGIGCDTLRNWIPADPYYYATVGAGNFIQGHSTIGGKNSLEWAEPHVATASTKVKALEFAVYKAVDGGGDVIFRVYNDGGGAPGSVITADTVPLANIADLAWNNIAFDTPPTVTGTFWVGYQLDYSSTDTFALFTNVDNSLGANYTYLNQQGTGWTDISSLLVGSPKYASLMDVLTSNGDDPIMTFVASDDSVCVNGEIIVDGSGSQFNEDYRWYIDNDFPPANPVLDLANSSSNTFSFPYAPGSYYMYLYGDGSCITDAVYMPVEVLPSVAATVTPTATTCGLNNGSITITSESGGDGTYYYSLDGTNYQTGNTFTGLAAGNYDVYIATFGDNCEAMYTVTVGTSTEITATASANQSICPGGSATISASGGISYVWTDGVTILGNTSSIVVSPTTQTQYACLVTDGTGCQGTVYTTVSVDAVPIATATNSGTSCEGESITVNEVGGQAVSWTWSSDGSASFSSGSAQNPTVNEATDGETFTVNIIDANGCTSSSSTTVTIIPAPVISSGTVSNPTTCATSTGSIEINGPGASGTLNWSGSASGSITTTLPYTIGSLGAGSYTITFTDGNGCESDALIIGLNDPSAPIFSLGANVNPTTCGGTQGTITLTGLNASTTYDLTYDDNGTGVGPNSITTDASGNYTIPGLDAGTYSNFVASLSGCTGSQSGPIVLTDPSLPNVSATNSGDYCTGDAMDVNETAGDATAWSWSSSGSATFSNANAQNPTVTGAVSGETFTVTVTDGNGCQNTAQTVITINPLPNVNAINSGDYCVGDAMTVNENAGEAVTWSWTSDGSATFSSTTAQNPTISSAVDGETFTVIVTDGNGCSNSSQTSITVNPNPSATASNSGAYCAGDAMAVNETAGDAVAWNWASDGAANFSSATAQNPTVTGAVDGETFTVTVTDANGCTNTSQTTITINALPTVTVTTDDTTCNNYTVVALNGSPAGGTYSGSGVTGSNFDPSIAGVGTHTITYTYTDGNGCTGTDSQDVVVDICTGIDEGVFDQLQVYPNPTFYEFTIVLDREFTFTLIDSRGRLVHKGIGSNEIKVNTAQYEAGVYFLSISSNDASTMIRLIKE